MNNNTKTCVDCGMSKPLNNFYKDRKAKDGKQSSCKQCNKKYQEEHQKEIKKYKKEWYEHGGGRERRGCQSMYKNKSSTQWLGIVIGERLVKHLFNDVVIMPYKFPDYDIICNKGKKINVKVACITLNRKLPHWQFNIDYNTIADYFILVAFDNRENLNPLYLWMIPGYVLNEKSGTQISPSTIHKWDEWKRDINDAKLCCTEMKYAVIKNMEAKR